MALSLALERGKPFVPWKYMDEVRPNDSTLLAIASDIETTREAQRRATRSDIEQKLGYGPTSHAARQVPKASHSPKSSSKDRPRPGTRGPARDPVSPPPPANNL